MNREDLINAAKRISFEHNVSIRVLDKDTGAVIQEHTGHNSATNSLLLGIGYYLIGEGVFNQGSSMFKDYIPQYISLGTMGLAGQSQDAETGLPLDIGAPHDSGLSEEDRYIKYASELPGYGADGYEALYNNGRVYFGLGYPYTTYDTTKIYSSGDGVDTTGDLATYDGCLYRCIQDTRKGRFDPTCWELVTDLSYTGFEVISPTFPRAKIAYRDVVPEVYAEVPTTLDVVFSAMISTGALAQFRGDNDYVFISEAGLWASSSWVPDGVGENGLLAGYRIMPPDKANWDMSDAANRRILQQNILRVGRNQVVQVIWKIQLGSLEVLGNNGGSSDVTDIFRWYVLGEPEPPDRYFRWQTPGMTTPVSDFPTIPQWTVGNE